MKSQKLLFHPLVGERWDDLERLFGPAGAYANCWCAYFRQTGAEFKKGCANRGAGNRGLLKRLTAEGRSPGLLAYDETRPIGWVSVGPRTDFERYLRSPIARPRPDEALDASYWSVVCFYVPTSHRGTGLSRALLDAAIGFARESGASVLDAYPVDTMGKRLSPAELYVGTVDLFARAGFVEVERRVPTRPVMRLALRQRPDKGEERAVAVAPR